MNKKKVKLLKKIFNAFEKTKTKKMFRILKQKYNDLNWKERSGFTILFEERLKKLKDKS